MKAAIMKILDQNPFRFVVRKRRLFFESTFLEKKLHNIRADDQNKIKADPDRLGNYRPIVKNSIPHGLTKEPEESQNDFQTRKNQEIKLRIALMTLSNTRALLASFQFFPKYN